MFNREAHKAVKKEVENKPVNKMTTPIFSSPEKLSTPSIRKPECYSHFILTRVLTVK